MSSLNLHLNDPTSVFYLYSVRGQHCKLRLVSLLCFRRLPESEPDPVNEVVVHVHLLRRDVVEGDDGVGAAAGTLLQIVGLVLEEPVVGIPLA